MIFFKLSFRYFFKLFFALSVAVNELSSKHSQISTTLINFRGKILSLKEFEVP